MAKILLEMKNITKTFPGVKALDNVNFQVEEGEIHALVGENGAGKSTLMNVLSGIYPYGTYEGDIIYDGKVCQFHNIKDSEKLGIVIIHQELALVPEMTIGENMYLGNERGHKLAIDWNTTYSEADKYLRMVGLSESSLMLGFKKQGMTMIIISHKLNEVAYVADKITVVRDGATIETIDNRGPEPVSEERIIKGMVGREMTNRFPKREGVTVGDIQLEVDNWTVHHPLYPERKVVDNVSMYVRKGEVVGIYGLMGAGRTELAMSIFGQTYGVNISGTMKIDGKEVKIKKGADDAIRHKIAYVTEDRKGNGLVLSQSIKVNTSLAHLDAISNHMVIDGDKEYAVAEEYREKLKTKTPSVEQLVGNLSGGNQQKVLLAKWMFAEPDIMLLDEPTRGIDVGAKYEIYCIINDLAAAGKCVVMISSELPEVLGMSDRIYIMNEGKFVGEMKASEATQENIMALILQSGRGD